MGGIRLIKSMVVMISVGLVLAVYMVDPGTHVAGRDMDGTIAAPTRVTASDGDYANKIGINWDTIRGANLYRVFRNTTNNSATATDVGTTAANYFFDTTTQASQAYFYWVRAENGATLSNLSLPDQGLQAVGFVDNNALFTPLNPPVAPTGNDVTAAKAYLGKTLFWDEQLSSTRTVSCGTCHRPAAGGSDPRTGANFPGSRNPGFDQMFGTADDVFGSPAFRHRGRSFWRQTFRRDSQHGSAADRIPSCFRRHSARLT